MGSPASHGVPQPPQGWQPSHGIGGRLAMESVAAFVWNGWQLCRGISGRIHLESVAALAWNTQPCYMQGVVIAKVAIQYQVGARDNPRD